jgi:hypothetical protein
MKGKQESDVRNGHRENAAAADAPVETFGYAQSANKAEARDRVSQNITSQFLVRKYASCTALVPKTGDLPLRKKRKETEKTTSLY